MKDKIFTMTLPLKHNIDLYQAKYWFLPVETDEASSNSFSDIMVEECANYGMKPVCAKSSYCEDDSKAIYIGHRGILAHARQRNNADYQSDLGSDWLKIKDQWRNQCTYTGAHAYYNKAAECDTNDGNYRVRSPEQAKSNSGALRFICAAPVNENPTVSDAAMCLSCDDGFAMIKAQGSDHGSCLPCPAGCATCNSGPADEGKLFTSRREAQLKGLFSPQLEEDNWREDFFREYWFVKLPVHTVPASGSFSDLMVAECRKFGMKPVCDHPDYCGGDDKSIYIGQKGHISKTAHRTDMSKFPKWWSNVHSKWDKACAYTANKGSQPNAALCNTGGNHQWYSAQTAKEAELGFVCGSRQDPTVSDPQTCLSCGAARLHFAIEEGQDEGFCLTEGCDHSPAGSTRSASSCASSHDPIDARINSDSAWAPGSKANEVCDTSLDWDELSTNAHDDNGVMIGPTWSVTRVVWYQFEQLTKHQRIYGVQTQGHFEKAEWVSQFTASISDDCTNFRSIGGDPPTKFWANSAADGQIKTVFFGVEGVTGKCLRIYPTKWNVSPSMRIDLQCQKFKPRAPGCSSSNPPGSDRTIIGSTHEISKSDWKGLLDGFDTNDGYWHPVLDSGAGNALQFDLKVARSVLGIVIQGANKQPEKNSHNPTKVEVQVSDDGVLWFPVKNVNKQETMAVQMAGNEAHIYFDKDEVPSTRYLKVMLPAGAGWDSQSASGTQQDSQSGMDLKLRVGLICDVCMDTFRLKTIDQSFMDPPTCQVSDAGPNSCTDIANPQYLASTKDCMRMCDPKCMVKAQGCPFDLSQVSDDARCQNDEWAAACKDPSWTFEEPDQPTLTHMDALRLCQVKCNPNCDPSVLPMSATKPAWVPSAAVPMGHLHCKDKFTLVTELGNTKNRASPVPQRVSVCGTCDEGYALKPAYVMGFKIVGVCQRIEDNDVYVAMASRCADCNEGCEAPCTDLQSLTCYEFLGNYGEYEDPDRRGAGTMMPFQHKAERARAAANGERAMAFTCGKVAATDSEDAVTAWTDQDTDATGNIYRLVQMSVAECHSSKVDESDSMACVSKKMMATCHAAEVNVGKHATQAAANAALKGFDKATVRHGEWGICTKLQQRKLTGV